MLSSSEVIKLSSVLTKNKSFVEVKELIEDVEFLVKFWTGKLQFKKRFVTIKSDFRAKVVVFNAEFVSVFELKLDWVKGFKVN